MKTIESIQDIKTPFKVLMGNFDGVHLGHQFLIKRFLAQNSSLKSVLVTFLPHPAFVLSPHNGQKKNDFVALTLSAEKKELLSKLGLDYYLEIPFSFSLSLLPWDDFLKDYIQGPSSFCKFLYFGYDFCFGKNREGTFDKVFNWGLQHQIKVLQEKKYIKGGQSISSSFIRTLLRQGDIVLANNYLGYAYSLEGIVGKGHGEGKKMGLPTANLEILPETFLTKLIPKNGVYFVLVAFQNETNFSHWKGALNIGLRPTFKENSETIQKTIEVFLLNYKDKDFYGKKIKISFYRFHREERPFPSKDHLKEQIHKDINACDLFFQAPHFQKFFRPR